MNYNKWKAIQEYNKMRKEDVKIKWWIIKFFKSIKIKLK